MKSPPATRTANEPARCPVCQAADAPLRHRVPSPYLSGRVEYAIHGCRTCGHHFALGPCDESTLAGVYANSFHATTQQDAVGAGSPIVINAERRAQALAASELRGRLLDVGAGKGYFVRAAGAYFAAEGSEFSASAAEAARKDGLRVHTGAFPASAPDGPFDVVTLWDVLAGLADVHAAMNAVSERLAPGGRVILTMPLVSSRTARLLGRWWPLWIPPVNLHYFTPASIDRLLNAHGLSVLTRRTESKRVAVEFLLRKALRTARLAALESIAGAVPRGWSVNLDLGDIVTVEAVKTAEAAA